MNYIKFYNHYKKEYLKIKYGGGLNNDKILGVFNGVFVGDALGSRYEFMWDHQANDLIDNDLDKDGNLAILGGGPFSVEPGQLTDDSEMTISLLRSIVNMGKYDQNDVAKQYIEWYKSGPRDIGKTITKSIHTREISISSEDMKTNSLELNKNSLSNGVLMRISPIAILGLKLSDNELKDVIKKECELTHPNPIVQDVCFTFCRAIKGLIDGLDRYEVYTQALKNIKTPRMKIILERAKDYPEPVYLIGNYGIDQEIKTDSKVYQGYIGVAFQNAFYELLNGEDINKSLIDICRRGGDTDTNAAIAGALLGAYYGYNKIKKSWIQKINSSQNTRVEEHPRYSIDTANKKIKKLIDIVSV